MSNKPIKTISANPKRADGTYIKLANISTWDNEKWRWSINVTALRETLQLLDSGVIEAKNGYIGGNCGVFEKREEIPDIGVKYEKVNEVNLLSNNDEMPF